VDKKAYACSYNGYGMFRNAVFEHLEVVLCKGVGVLAQPIIKVETGLTNARMHHIARFSLEHNE